MYSPLGVTEQAVLERTLQVVIAEDNRADVKWMQIALNELGLNCILSVISDGEWVVNFILKRGPYLSAPDPDIIFLDLNLPKLTGVQVLDAIQDGRKHPVCVVTGSILERQIVRERFNLDDRCYIVKPAYPGRILEAFDCFDHLKPLADRIRKSALGPVRVLSS